MVLKTLYEPNIVPNNTIPRRRKAHVHRIGELPVRPSSMHYDLAKLITLDIN